MIYDTSTNTILDSEPLENDGELLTPLMAFSQEMLLDEEEAKPLDMRYQAEPGNEGVAVDYIVEKVARCCRESKVGKKLPTAFYVHISALATLNPVLIIYEKCARQNIPNIDKATLVKFQLHQPKISYLFYPDFDTDAHPALQTSIQINLETGEVKYFDYSNSENPPVLHRKETFVTADYPNYEKFARLTRCEEGWGLLDNTSAIGTRDGWLKYLGYCGVEIQDHTVVERLKQDNNELSIPKIERHKAAMVRNSLSKPVRLVLEADLFWDGATFFDYGCG